MSNGLGNQRDSIGFWSLFAETGCSTKSKVRPLGLPGSLAPLEAPLRDSSRRPKNVDKRGEPSRLLEQSLKGGIKLLPRALTGCSRHAIASIFRPVLIGSIICLFLIAGSARSDDTDDRADVAKRITQLGGSVRRDRTLLGNPIVRVDLDGSRLDDGDLRYIATIGTLRALYIWGPPGNVSAQGLAHLSRLKRLQVLALYGVEVSDKALSPLSKLQGLRELRLAGEFSDAGLVHLQPLTNLRILSLQDSWVTGTGLRHLCGLSELRELRLDYSPVSDLGLMNLKDFRNLAILSLEGTRMTDAGLKHLIPCTKLRKLSLRKTKVTEEGIRGLRRVMPDVSISPARE